MKIPTPEELAAVMWEPVGAEYFNCRVQGARAAYLAIAKAWREEQAVTQYSADYMFGIIAAAIEQAAAQGEEKP